jgi:hypothetical protein
MPDGALVSINIVLTFYCGNAGDGNSFQIVNGQHHIQGYLHFYLHAPHSATMIELILHIVDP